MLNVLRSSNESVRAELPGNNLHQRHPTLFSCTQPIELTDVVMLTALRSSSTMLKWQVPDSRAGATPFGFHLTQQQQQQQQQQAQHHLGFTSQRSSSSSSSSSSNSRV
jgi:hypothetical protein